MLVIACVWGSRLSLSAGPVFVPPPPAQPLPSVARLEAVAVEYGRLEEVTLYKARVIDDDARSGKILGQLGGVVGGLALGVDPTHAANAGYDMGRDADARYSWELRTRLRVRLSSGRVITIVQLANQGFEKSGVDVKVNSYPGGIVRAYPDDRN